MKKSSKNKKNSSNKGAAAASVTKGSKRESSPSLGAKGITMIVVSAILAIALIVGLVIIFINKKESEEDKSFDYITSDLSKYITIDEAVYKNYSVTLDIAKPKDIDVNITLINLLATKKGDVKNSGLVQSSGYIDAGDVVNIYYRGYTLDENNNQVVFATNFGNKNSSGEYIPSALEVGVGIRDGENVYSFPNGFDLNLAGEGSIEGQGRYFDSANNFKRITSGLPSGDQIIYVSYTRQLNGSTASSDTITRSAERIVLSEGKDKIDEKYGKGFYELITTRNIGSSETTDFSGEISGKQYNYTKLKIDFATECEKKETYFLVECYLPYNYTVTTLRNKDAYYEVYVQSIIEYDTKKLTNDFVNENLGKKDFGVTVEELDKHEGDRVNQLRQYVKTLIDEDYKELYKTELEEAMWNHYHKNVTETKKYPKAKVDAIYNEYFNDVLFQFKQSGGVYTDYWGEETTYETVDEYAVAYLQLTSEDGKDWRGYLRSIAETLAKERLILYYIMREENLMPTAEELAARKKEVEDEYLEEYIYQYSKQYSIDKDTYSEEAWAEFEAERYKELHDYYNDEYFTEIAYYEIGLDAFLTWPSVTTMDGKVQ